MICTWSATALQLPLPVVVAVFEFGFMGGSMGQAVGEAFIAGAEAAIAQVLCAETLADAAKAAVMQLTAP